MNKLACVFTACTALLLLNTGCALSPQQIQIQPAVNVTQQSVGNNQTIAVSTHDARTTPVIGSRGGMYAETSTIEVIGMESSMLAAATSGLTQLGFSTTTADNSNGELPDFHISVNSIKYTMPTQTMPADVGVKVEIGLQVVNANRTYKGKYSAHATRRFVTAPSFSDNRELINSTVEQALQQLFLDEKMREFMAQR